MGHGNCSIYGATGRQEYAVVQKLLKTHNKLRVLLREKKYATEFEHLGAEVVYGDLTSGDSLIAATVGVDKVSLVLPVKHDVEELFAYGKQSYRCSTRSRREIAGIQHQYFSF